jgi:hypothetical protein
MSEYILVAFILKDKSDIPYIRSGMTSDGKEINIRGKELFFNEAYFKITHFRVLDLSTLSLKDISVDDYCKSGITILGLSNSVMDFYEDILSKQRNKVIKDISLSINSLHPIVCRSRSYLRNGIKSIDFRSVIPFLFDDKPVYGSNLVIFEFFNYTYLRLRLIVNYINGDISLYAGDAEVLFGDYLITSNMEYHLGDYRSLHTLGLRSDSNFSFLNALMFIGYRIENCYAYNDDCAIIFDYPSNGCIIVPSSVSKILLYRYNYDFECNCSIVIPPKASVKCLIDKFSLSKQYGITLIVSSKLNSDELDNLLSNIIDYECGDGEVLIDKVKNSQGIGIEFY